MKSEFKCEFLVLILIYLSIHLEPQLSLTILNTSELFGLLQLELIWLP